MEILSPVKNLEAAKIVIGAGADAIYFASPSFGARAAAAIAIEDAKAIIKYARENKVASYATFNTVIFNDELEQFFTELDELYQVGLDAVIVQDISFINLIKQYYPDLDVHASTQMHVHNSFASNLVKNEGSNRIVVPREMNYERIETIKQNCDIEIEAFVHGALCVSYSGQCYDSTLLDQKSANRGRCSQYCRMPQHVVYQPTRKIVSNGEYPLNLKDQCNLENLQKYEQAGVDSLKIEGRLKSPDYAYYTTQAYKQQLALQKMSDLTEVYNREFTNGRINGTNGRALVSLYRPNNNGKKIGQVIKVEKNTAKSLKYYEFAITVKLTANITIQKQDNLRFTGEDFEDGQVLEQFKILPNNCVLIYSNVMPEPMDDVYRTLNYQIYKQAMSAKQVTNRQKHNINLFLKNNVLWFAISNKPPRNSGIVFEKVKNQPVTKAMIIKKLAKTKNTPFDLNVIDFRYNDNLFCQISKINKLKQMIIEQLLEESEEYKFSNKIDLPSRVLKSEQSDANYYIEVSNKEQYETVINYNSDYHILIENIELASEITPRANDYFVTPKVMYDDEFSQITQICDKFDNLCVSEIGLFAKYRNSKKIITNYTFNTTNYINQQKLIADGASKTLLSIELNESKLSDMAADESIVNIYGRVSVMIMDYCPINMNKQNGCQTCRRCRNNEYVLEDKLGRKFPLVYAGNDRIQMLSRKPISLLSKQQQLMDLGIANYHLRFTLETKEQVLEVLTHAHAKSNELSFDTNTGSFHKTTL